MYVNYFYIVNTIQFCGYRYWTEPLKTAIWVFPKVNWSWMDIRSSKGVQITGPSIMFTGHSHTRQRRCSDSYWSFGPVMNNFLLVQANFYWTLPHVWLTMPWEWLDSEWAEIIANSQDDSWTHKSFQILYS